MKTGELIKYHRKRLDMTQEELGAKLGVNKAAVQKWESGAVRNIKKDNLKELARLFQINLAALLEMEESLSSESLRQFASWDTTFNNGATLTSEAKVIEQIQIKYGDDILSLLQAFNSLNDMGRKKAIENISDLAAIPKYVGLFRAPVDVLGAPEGPEIAAVE
jgi:transcriptional regulator with XRE-family HTH domain